MKSAAKSALLAAVALALVQGVPATARKSAPTADLYGPTADYPIVIGDPYVAGGTTFTPSDTMNYDAVGYALAGEGSGVTGAHHTLPIPSYVEVTALDSGRTVLVRLDKRGPTDSADLIQLAPGALAQLGLSPSTSHAPVRVRRVNPPEQERTLLRTGQQAPARMDTPPGLLNALKRKLGIVAPQGLDDAAGAAQAPVALPRPAAVRPVALPKPPQPRTPAKPAPPPVPPQTLAPIAKPAPAPAQPAPQRPAAAHAQAVQVGAFSARDRAEKVARALGGTVSASGKVFRVRLPAGSPQEAQAALAKAHRAGYADARILSAD